MRYSTAAKYKGLLNVLLQGDCKIYSGERIPRYPKAILLDSTNKELSKRQADYISQALIRQAKPINESLCYGISASKARRFTIRKEYLTEEESLKLITETPLCGVAGWYFWVQETPSQEEYFAEQYQLEVLAEKQSPVIPNEEAQNNGEVDYD